MCITAIVQQQMEVPPDTVSSIQPQHADLLLVALQKALKETRVKLDCDAVRSKNGSRIGKNGLKQEACSSSCQGLSSAIKPDITNIIIRFHDMP